MSRLRFTDSHPSATWATTGTRFRKISFAGHRRADFRRSSLTRWSPRSTRWSKTYGITRRPAASQWRPDLSPITYDLERRTSRLATSLGAPRRAFDKVLAGELVPTPRHPPTQLRKGT